MGVNEYNGQPIVYDDEFSLKNFSGQSFEKDLSGLTIFTSNFAQEIPDTQVFSPKMTGATFVNCNLDNVLIPPGNTVIGGTQRRYQAQSDGQDWIVDANNVPTEPLNPPSDDEIPIDTSGGTISIPVTLDGTLKGEWVFIKA
jgi:hypothetical protein